MLRGIPSMTPSSVYASQTLLLPPVANEKKEEEMVDVPKQFEDGMGLKDMVSRVREKNQALEIEYKDIVFEKRLGNGRFGEVFLASWINEQLAVKTFTGLQESMGGGKDDEKKDEKSEEETSASEVYESAEDREEEKMSTPLEKKKKKETKGEKKKKEKEKEKESDSLKSRKRELFAEIVLASSLPHHPNLVRFVGYSINPLCVLMNFMPGGSVEDYVYLKKASKLVTVREKCIIFLRALSGLKFLHDYNLVHRDIAARNILLGKMDYRGITMATKVQISDFGMSRIIEKQLYGHFFFFFSFTAGEWRLKVSRTARHPTQNTFPPRELGNLLPATFPSVKDKKVAIWRFRGRITGSLFDGR